MFSPGLQALLRTRVRKDSIEYPLERRASVKDVVESIGIPHTEVGAIRVAGRETDFGFIPEPRQKLKVNEVDPPFDVTRSTRLRPDPIPAVRFVVDVNVGRLAALLRLTGFDAAYENGLHDNQIAELAHHENRIVLSKDRALMKRSKIVFGRLVRAVQPEAQLIETLRFFGLTGPYNLFSRCLRCNRKLQPVAKAAILHRLEPKTKRYFNTFKTCPDCDRIYWRGSHCDAMAARLERFGLNKD
ncbi:MAG: hypothetical protein GY697_08515 [Desulfobacterales bacterium]|nr:hypothetical protein [Desulfobacterales bacterium]